MINTFLYRVLYRIVTVACLDQNNGKINYNKASFLRAILGVKVWKKL